uniref:Acyl-CoA-binding domain-containing protein 5 n=1 Tax=Anthurium amnicola TaxID=1678845 RepID=A0A1D1XJC7_9ARAE
MRWEKVHVNARAKESPETKMSVGKKGWVWGPGRRWGHTCNSVKDGRLLYLFGGYGEDNCQTNDVHIFDTVKQTWSKPMVKGNPPLPRDSHTCTTVGNKLYVFGGTDGKNPLNDFHVLDTSTNTWVVPITYGKGPDAREGHGAALVGNRLFIFGGCGKSAYNSGEVYYDDLYIFDTVNDFWQCAATYGTPPSARDSHTCSSWRNKIIVLGGEDASDCYLSDVHMLDTDTMVWKELNTSGQMPAPRAGHSTVALGRNLIVFGGFTDHRNLYDDLHVLNLDTGVWNKVTNVNQGPSARFSAAGDCVDPQNGTLLLIGGCNESLEALDDMYYLLTDVKSGGREAEGRREKLSFRKELKKKCQESRYISDNNVHSIGMTSNSSQTGMLLPYSNPVEERTFHAIVVGRIPNGYTVETRIKGQLLRGVLLSCNPSFNLGRHSHINNNKRTGMNTDARLSDEYQQRLKTAKSTHLAIQNAHEGVVHQVHSKIFTTIQPHRETLGLSSTSMVPADDVNQAKRVLESGPPSVQEVHLRDEQHDCPNSTTTEAACENPTVAEETLPKLSSKGKYKVVVYIFLYLIEF